MTVAEEILGKHNCSRLTVFEDKYGNQKDGDTIIKMMIEYANLKSEERYKEASDWIFKHTPLYATENRKRNIPLSKIEKKVLELASGYKPK